MPPNFSTSARLGFRFPSDTPSPNVISDFAPLMATMAADLDSKLMGYSEGTFAARPAAGISNRIYRATDSGVYYIDTGLVWAQLAGPRLKNDVHSWTVDDASTINSSSVKVASFPVYPAAGETVSLVGAAILCDAQGATASVFRVQTDHAVRGTYADVPGLAGLTPATGAYVFVAASPALTLIAGDGVRIVASNAGSGTSKGVEVAPITLHTF